MLSIWASLKICCLVRKVKCSSPFCAQFSTGLNKIGYAPNDMTFLGNGRKLCGEVRKCWSQVLSHFPTMFSKACLPTGKLKLNGCTVNNKTRLNSQL